MNRLTLTYPIEIGAGLLESDLLIQTLAALKSSLYAIITDTTVEPLYGKTLQKQLERHSLKTTLISFPPGEQHKTRSTKELCEDRLLDLKAGRDTCIIGLGGGIVTDVAGFVAATYCRGVPSLLIPTSLLAMVDASIGGKTGVNVPQGKNLIGTITQPHAVFIDTTVLKTLPLAEIKNGLAEAIKHAWIGGSENISFLEQHAEQILQLDPTILEELIYQNVKIKAQIVQEDEAETGKRRLLNFGHTVAHALESATHHEIPHGRAVAIGMLAETQLSSADSTPLRRLIDLFQIDLTLPHPLTPAQLLQAMTYDKKALRHTPRFVLFKGMGAPLPFDGQYCAEVPAPQLLATLQWLCSAAIKK